MNNSIAQWHVRSNDGVHRHNYHNEMAYNLARYYRERFMKGEIQLALYKVREKKPRSHLDFLVVRNDGSKYYVNIGTGNRFTRRIEKEGGEVRHLTRFEVIKIVKDYGMTYERDLRTLDFSDKLRASASNSVLYSPLRK